MVVLTHYLRTHPPDWSPYHARRERDQGTGIVDAREHDAATPFGDGMIETVSTVKPVMIAGSHVDGVAVVHKCGGRDC